MTNITDMHPDEPSKVYTEEEYSRISRLGRQLSVRNNPLVADMADMLPWYWYDRLTFAANTTLPRQLTYFVSPISPTKTKLDTNLLQAGRLPDPKRFVCTNVRFIFSPNTLMADAIAIFNNYYVEFEIGDKVFAEGLPCLYPGGAGLYGFGAAGSALSNGYPSPAAVNDWGLDRGLTILQGQSFQVRLISPAPPTLSNASGAPGLNLLCVLDGVLWREVQ